MFVHYNYVFYTQRHHTQSNMTRARDEVYCKLTSNLLENVNRDVFRGACTMTSDSSYIFVRVQRSELLTAH